MSLYCCWNEQPSSADGDDDDMRRERENELRLKAIFEIPS